MQVNFREIWYNYRSEVVFFIVLSAIVALSTYLSQFIPETVFDNTITPILITATVATALIGVLLMHREDNGAAHSWDITKYMVSQKENRLSLFSSDSER